MKLIFDFDDVLFDAKSFKDEMFSYLTTQGFNHVDSVYQVLREEGSPFSLLGFLEKLAPSLSHEERSQMYQEILGCAFGKVNEPLRALIQEVGKENCFIVTQGSEKFQLEKIRRSIGIESVKKVIVVESDKGDVIEEICRQYKDEDVIFVDDKDKFLKNIRFELCPNLKTVLYNEHGLENLQAEVAASQEEERHKELRDQKEMPSFMPEQRFR